jgi:hypothetical protein
VFEQDSAQLKTLRYARAPPEPGLPTNASSGPYWSIMLEISESSMKPVDFDSVVEEAIQGCINVQLCQPEDQIVSIFHRRLEHGYPTPSLARDSILNEALPYLRERSIWSRGRFGAYKYEVANQDHSLMQGVEAVDNILFGATELTVHHPDIVNARGNKNTQLVFSKHA